MKILIISSDPVSREMAGLGIRNFYMARFLAKKFPKHSIKLAVPNATDLKESSFDIIRYRNNFDKLLLILQSNLIISQGFGFAGLISYSFQNKKFLLDLYDPIQFEWLETGQFVGGSVYSGRNKFNKDYLNLQLRLADFVVCANDRQRDMWIGMLFSMGLISTGDYRNDPTLRNLIDVVGFGIRDTAISKKKKVLKGVVKGINENDKVLIWNGGIWNWFDPLTLIKAIGIISKNRSDIKLYFLGTKHPNPEIKELRILNDSVALAQKLGVYNKFVFFNSGWTNYEESKEYLLESDIGISTYHKSLETRFSHRTRFLDFFWAGLPIICTEGDFFSDQVRNNNLGIVIPEKSVTGLVGAIEKLADDREFYQKCKQKLEVESKNLTWENCLRPIFNFCENPRRSSRRHLFNFVFYFNYCIFFLRASLLKLIGIY